MCVYIGVVCVCSMCVGCVYIHMNVCKYGECVRICVGVCVYKWYMFVVCVRGVCTLT